MVKRIPFRSLDISYRIFGKGNPVILLHGFAENGHVWNNQVTVLEHKFRIIIPDIPGSGESSYNESLTTIDDFADAVKAVAVAEQIQILTLIGHSMGAYIALSFAEKYSEYLNGLGLFHSTAFPDHEEKKLTRRKSISFIREFGAEEFIGLSAPNLFSEKYKEMHSDNVDVFVNSLNGFDPRALIAYSEAMIGRPERTLVLKQANFPVLFIAGEQDKTVPLQDSLKQCWLADQSFVHILKHSAHMGMMEEISESNSAILEFLNQIWT